MSEVTLVKSPYYSSVEYTDSHGVELCVVVNTKKKLVYVEIVDSEVTGGEGLDIQIPYEQLDNIVQLVKEIQ